MKKTFLKLCSALLCLILLVNMLPMSILAEEFQQNLAQKETISATDEVISAKPTQIVSEIAEKRTEYAKEYLLGNGMRMAVVYPDAVHYQKDGEWEEIDNTLTAKTTGVLTNTAGQWKVSFPQQLTQTKQITIEKDGYTLSFGMAGELRNTGLEVATVQSNLTAAEQAEAFSTTAMQNTTATVEKIDLTAVKKVAEYPETVSDKLQSRLKYTGVFDNTDVTYDLDSNTVKESIILKEYSSTLRGYRYTLNVGQLRPVLEDDGQITFYDSKQENVVIVMPAPYLVDANQEFNDEIQVQLTGSGSTYTLTYLLPQQWLAAEERQWPVILDPVVKASTLKDNIQDVTVSEGKTYDHKWGMLQCGHSDTYGLSRFYVKYNELPAITSSDVVLGATISIYKHISGSTAMQINAHKVSTEWTDESMTWSNKPGYNTTVEDFALVTNEGFYTWDIVDVVRDWYANKNTGVMFKVPDSKENVTTDTFRQFRSVDYGYNRPTLYVMFRNNNGLEGYWDYSSASAGRAGTGYINQFTGNLTWVRSDIGFDGNRMPASINHVYNLNDSNAVSDSNNSNNSAGNFFGLGNGWRTNYHQRVFQWNVDDNYYVWEDADGTDHYFKKTATNTYEDEDGLELTLKIVNSTHGKYTITDKNGNVSYFDTTGRLVKQVNNQQDRDSINVTYTNAVDHYIQQITDGVGRKYIFTYTNNLLSRISYQAYGTTEVSYVSFAYSGTKLTTVTNADGKSSSYTYSSYLLKTATDVDGYKLTYSYNSPAGWQPYRVTSVQESHNSTTAGKLTFSYGRNETIITDQNGKSEFYQFNDLGNTVSIRDDQGRAQFCQYALNTKTEADNNTDATKKGNQLRVASKLQASVANYLPYNSFESGNNWTTDSTSLTFARTTAQHHLGNYSLKMTNSSTDTVVLKSVSCTLANNDTFNFSAYIKSDDAAGNIAVEYNGTLKTGESFVAGSGWKRYQISFTNTTGATVPVICCIVLTTGGTAYLDSVQLQRNQTAARLNLLENGDIIYTGNSFPKSWTGNGTTSSDIVEIPDEPAPRLHRKAFKMVGSATTVKRIHQTLNISGAKNDTYVLAGWAKGNSAPLTSDDRKFGLIATFNNTDGTKTTLEVKFNPDTDSWQYASTPLVAKKAYSSIKIEVAYDKNINTVYFDGIQLFKEQFGNSYTYDADGNVTSVADLQGKKTQYQYTNNNLTKEILPSGAELTYTYDSWHNVKTAETTEGLKYSFTYDIYGNNTSVSITDTDSNVTMTTSATYSANSNYLRSTTDAAGNTTTYIYHADTGMLTYVTNPTETDTTRAVYSYDQMYRMKKATDKVSSPYSADASVLQTQQANYTYENDQLKTVTTPGATYSFTYGDFGLRTGVSVGEQSLASYSYTTDGYNRLNKLDYGNGDSVQYTYSSKDGSLTKQTYEDGKKVTYAYNTDGTLSSVSDGLTGRKTEYFYDLTERLTKVTESATGHSFSKSYSYDSSNRLASSSEVLNGFTRNIVYTYDDDNRISAYQKASVSQNYTYDAFGRNSSKVIKRNGTTLLTTTPTFRTVNGNATGQIAQMSNVAADYNATYSYTYDGNGNILSISNGANTTSYEYDQSNQLVRENNQEGNYTYVWVYDTAGNILSRTKYAYTTGELGSPTETVNYTYGNSGWKDQLTGLSIHTFTDNQVTNRSFTYDNIGNPLTDDIRTYTWEHGRQLATLTQNGTTWTNTYNADGLRAERTDGTNTYQYYYSDGNLISMTRNGTKVYIAYTPDGLPYNIAYGGNYYIYALNQQGDVMAILNEAGKAVVEYTYDAWGNILSCTGSMATTLGVVNPLHYRGYVYDNETQLYYLQSRYYDPEIGRFINADGYTSTGQGILGNNAYAYCGNNPVANIDKAGTRHEISAGGAGYRDVTDEIMHALHKECKQINDFRTHSFLESKPPLRFWGFLASIPISNMLFYAKVNHGAPWDIKRKTPWENTIGTRFPASSHTVMFNDMIMTPEMLGNFTYGYLGREYGFPLIVLYGGSYYAADFPTAGEKLKNEIWDWEWITKGYQYHAVSN